MPDEPNPEEQWSHECCDELSRLCPTLLREDGMVLARSLREQASLASLGPRESARLLVDGTMGMQGDAAAAHVLAGLFASREVAPGAGGVDQASDS